MMKEIIIIIIIHRIKKIKKMIIRMKILMKMILIMIRRRLKKEIIIRAININHLRNKYSKENKEIRKDNLDYRIEVKVKKKIQLIKSCIKQRNNSNNRNRNNKIIHNLRYHHNLHNYNQLRILKVLNKNKDNLLNHYINKIIIKRMQMIIMIHIHILNHSHYLIRQIHRNN